MERKLAIANKVIDDDSPAFIVAEIGHNHQGSLDQCLRLVEAAKDCGADAVKLQKRNNKKLYMKSIYNMPYVNRNSYGRTYGEHREFLEFEEFEYKAIKGYCQKLDIIFFATAFDIDSANFLRDLDMPAYKIASWDITNIPLIEHIAGFGKPIIISTGGCCINDMTRVYGKLKGNFAFLHCVASYPTRPEDMRLNLIPNMKIWFPDIVIGHSDHYNGIVMAEAAYIMGARIIEKHFTLNHTLKGTDHALSLEPQGLKKLIRDIRRLEVAMGGKEKKTLNCEWAAIMKQGNAIHPARFIPEGKEIELDDICIKAPAEGLPPYEFENVIGRIAISELSTADILDYGKVK